MSKRRSNNIIESSQEDDRPSNVAPPTKKGRGGSKALPIEKQPCDNTHCSEHNPNLKGVSPYPFLCSECRKRITFESSTQISSDQLDFLIWAKGLQLVKL